MTKIVQMHTGTLRIVFTGLILLTTINILSAAAKANKNVTTTNSDIASKLFCRHSLLTGSHKFSFDSRGRTVSPALVQVYNKHKRVTSNSFNKGNRKALNNRKPYAASTAALDSVTELLRLKLYINRDNYDDIAIGFNSGASFAYNSNEDSKYMPGIDAPEGLASYSSDGVPLSINFLPLPAQNSEVIRLDVEAASSGNITLKRTELD